MKTLLILLAIAFVSFEASAQVINFGYDSNGNRIIRYESPNLTGDDDDTDAIATRNLEEIDIKYYPNPVSNQLTVELDSDVKEVEISTIAIYNSLGILALKTSTVNKINQLDVSKLLSGTYFLIVNQGEKEFRQIMIKI